MFNDTRADTPPEALYKERRAVEERSEAHRAWSEAFSGRSGGSAARERSRERGGAGDALVEGAKAAGGVLEAGAREATEAVREGAERTGAAVKSGFRDAGGFMGRHA